MRFFRIAALLFIVTAGLFFGIRFLELSLTFHPAPYRASAAEWSPPANAREFWINNPNGQKLNAWQFRPPATSSRGIILYHHGNGGNLAGLRDFSARISAQGYEIIVWDYPGYGRSDGPLPAQEEALFRSAEVVYDFFSKQTGQPLNVWGQSLGSTAAADLCSRRPCRALVMESGLSSARRYAETSIPWLPSLFHIFARNSFDSEQKLTRVKCPLLVAHGTVDETIPDSHARILYANAASKPKHLLLVSGGTHWLPGTPGYVEKVVAFSMIRVAPGRLAIKYPYQRVTPEPIWR